jgi:aminoglycoside phosphotransferase (APT) family kinase protein
MSPGPAFDPDDVAAIANSLASFLSERYSGITLARLPERFSGGLDTYVYDIRLAGVVPGDWPARVVLRIYPVPEQGPKAEREFAVQRFLSSHDFPAPRPLLADVSGQPFGLPFMLMERAPGSAAIDRFKHPLHLLGTLRDMAALQARLHAVPIAGFPLPYDRPLAARLLDEPRGLLERYPSSAAQRALNWLDENADIVGDEGPVIVHNDFHPVNIVADARGHLTLLDWSNAALGDHHSDVARTLAVFTLAPDFERNRLASIALRAIRGFVVSRYASEYSKHARLSRKRLRYWGALHAFCEWVTVETMERYGEAAIGARAGVADEVPRGFSLALARYFETCSGVRTGALDASTR